MFQSAPPTIQEYFLRPGYIYLTREPTLISTVLGSCVAVTLWDKKLELGGINHFLFPMVNEPREATARYGNVAMNALIRLFLEEGSRKDALEAQIFGGACLPDSSREAQQVGEDNVSIGREILGRNGIPIISEDIGGTRGRKLIFNSLTNEVVILRVDRLRESDWYPYRDNR